MKPCATVVLVLSMCASVAALPNAVDGNWQGEVHLDGQTYRFVVHLASDANGAPYGTLDSPDTGNLGTPLQSLQADENSISFETSSPIASFTGKFSADHARLAGTWKQKGEEIQLTLTRAAEAPDFKDDGSYVFHSHCSSCHTEFGPMRAPWPSTLRQMMQSSILTALESGKMSAVGASLSHEQRVAVATYLGRKQRAAQTSQANTCPAGPPMANTPLWNGWGVDLSNSRFQPANLAGITNSQISRLKVKWAFGYDGATSAGGPPTIVGDRIFVAGGDGRVYSLNMHSGCAYWTFLPAAIVRTAITVSPDGAAAYFGDVQGRAYAIDTGSGSLLWKTEVDRHPFAMITGAPRLYNGKLYVPVSSAEELGAANPKYACCTFRGSVSALNSKTGSILWKTYTIPTEAAQSLSNEKMLGPSGAGVWTSPTIDPERHALYIGTGDNYSEPASATSDSVMALDLESGNILWTKQLTPDDRFNIGCFQPGNPNCPKNPGGDFDVGAPPILRTLAGKPELLVGQKSGVAYALDPGNAGAILWQTRIGKGGPLGGIEFGGAVIGTHVYYPLSDFTRDPKSGGGMFALDIANGKTLWSTPAPAPACIGKDGCGASQQAPATAIPGAVFSASLDGHIRAYDADDGKIIWDFDTARDYQTVNGVTSHGGSINNAGTVVAGGMVFVASGYSINAGMPGNVLLAFTVNGK